MLGRVGEKCEGREPVWVSVWGFFRKPDMGPGEMVYARAHVHTHTNTGSIAIQSRNPIPKFVTDRVRN